MKSVSRLFVVCCALVSPPLAVLHGGEAEPLGLSVEAHTVLPGFFDDAASGERLSARERLEREGIVFGPGGTAIYHPERFQLIVRGEPQIHLRIRELLEARDAALPLQVLLGYRILETRRPLFPPGESADPSLVVDSDSGARIAVDGAASQPPLLRPSRTFASGAELDEWMRRAVSGESDRVRLAPTVFARSRNTVEFWIADALASATPLLSEDRSAAGLEIEHLHGRWEGNPRSLGRVHVVIPSGGTVAFEERLDDGRYRTRLVTATVCDPTGTPLPPVPPGGAPQWDSSLFPEAVPDPAIEKVKSIVIPSLEFDRTPLAEAVAILKAASVEHDPDPSGKRRGVNLFLLHPDEKVGETPVTLRLANVPLFEAVRYTAALAGCKVRIEGAAVLIVADEKSASTRTNKLASTPTYIWRAGFLHRKAAKDLEKAGDLGEARKRYRQALNLYRALKEKHPGYHPEIVRESIRLLEEKLGGGGGEE